MYFTLSPKMRQMYKQLHILLSYSLYWQYAGEKWLIKNRGFEDDRFERRTSAEYSVQSLFVIPNNVLSADNPCFSVTTSAQLLTEKREKHSSGKSFWLRFWDVCGKNWSSRRVETVFLRKKSTITTSSCRNAFCLMLSSYTEQSAEE